MRRKAVSLSGELMGTRGTRANGVAPPRRMRSASKPKHVDHAGDRIKAEHDENVRRGRAQSGGGALDIGFHRGLHEPTSSRTRQSCQQRVYAKLMPHSTKF
jgi:hypothetical protein